MQGRRRTPAWRAPVIAVLWVVLAPAWADTVVMRVYLNAEDKGDHFFEYTADGDVLLARHELEAMGLLRPPRVSAIAIDGKPHLSLRSMAPGVRYTVDEREPSLRITADPELLPRHSVDLATIGSTTVAQSRDSAAFVNYSLNSQLNEGRGVTALSLPFEVGVSAAGLLGFSSFSYTHRAGRGKAVRLFSNLTRDDPETTRRYVLGDYSAASGLLGGGGSFGGLSVATDFSINPTLITFPGLDVSGILASPSEVEIEVNERLVRTEKLPPGAFDIRNLPATSGAGEASLLIRDAFGREQRLVIPFYQSTALLKPGLHDFLYSFGKKRRDLGVRHFSYGEAAFVGFHRYGFSRGFTGGAWGEADRDTLSLGPTAIVLLGRMGQLDAILGFSTEHGRRGYGGSLGYAYGGRWFNFSASLSARSRRFANLNRGANDDKTRLAAALGAGISHRTLGALSARVSFSDSYRTAPTRRASLFYSRQLGKRISLQVQASASHTNALRKEVFAGLIFHLGNIGSGNIGYRRSDGTTTRTVDFNRSAPRGHGFGYRLHSERSTNAVGEKRIRNSASGEYRGPYGVYTANWRRSPRQTDYDATIAGALAWIDHGLHLSRPIHDSFALAKVGDLEGVTVAFSNAPVGETNAAGEILVPDLISHYDNRLSIDSRGIPVNYAIEATEVHVTPPLRGGAVVSFDVRKLQGFGGQVYFVRKGNKTAAEYAGLELELARGPRVVTLGTGGELYLENIPAGHYPARLFLHGIECRFTLEIPKSNEIMVDLGELYCAMD